MILSRIRLNTDAVSTKRAIANPQIIHAAVEACINNEERKLWRIDYLATGVYLLILSPSTPDFDKFEFGVNGESREYSRLLEQLKNGMHLGFRLRANPTYTKSAGTGNRGQIYAHVTIEQRRNWLLDKAPKCGFSLNENEFDIITSDNIRFRKKQGQKNVELGIAEYEGLLCVEDAEIFKKALIDGIGRAKAYGCGMLTVVNPR